MSGTGDPNIRDKSNNCGPWQRSGHNEPIHRDPIHIHLESKFPYRKCAWIHQRLCMCQWPNSYSNIKRQEWYRAVRDV